MTGERRITNYDDLTAAFRARFVEIDMTYKDFEQVFGFAEGHIGKLMGEAQVKKIGPHSLDGLLEHLACDLVLVDNPERRARMEPFWQKRERPDYSANRIASVGKTTINRMLPVIRSAIAKQASDARMTKMKPAARRRVARIGARARWKDRRKARRARTAKTPPAALQPASV